MTSKQIEKKMSEEQKKVQIKFQAAMKIRDILDAAAKEYGSEASDDDLESGILELVTEE